MKTFADFGIDLRGRSGTEVKTTCPKCSHTRKKRNYPCLNLNTEKGVWHCWHCDWSGSLMQGEERRSNPFAWMQRTYRRPEYAPRPTLDAKALDWLRARGLTDVVIERAQIGFGKVYMPQVEKEVGAIQFPYLRDGDCVNIKYRDAQKNFRLAGGAERIVYGLDDIQNVDTAIVVEGEIDKLSLAVADMWNCLSVPDGAPAVNTKNYSSKFDFLDSAKERLDAVKRFILAVDGDAPGQKLEEELARRLGPERCYRVRWPEGCKDANDVLLTHGRDALKGVIDAARPYPVEGIFEVSDISDRIRTIHQDGLPKGESTGWSALDGLYSVRAGEWTVVTGVPSHGKSEWLDALMVNLMISPEWSFGVFSAENQPLELHFLKLAEKLVGKPFNEGSLDHISLDELEDAMAWLQERLFFVLPESPTIDCILDRARVLVFRRGIRGLIVDPWNELDHSRPQWMTETEYVSQCLTRVRAFARRHGVHVWIVAHPTKLQKQQDGTYPVPTPYDIAGSAHWRNKADHAIAVWRNVQDESDRTVQIHVQKVRFKELGKPGLGELIYHKPTGRYYDLGKAPHEVIYRVHGL